MGFIWFILFIIFLVLWINTSSELKRSRGRDYQLGLSDGYEMARDQARAVRESNQDDTKTLDQFLDVTNPSHEDTYIATANTAIDQENIITSDPVQENTAVENSSPQVAVQYEDKFIPDPKEVERVKTAQTLKNLNIILYVASFLIVAATAIFVTLTMPAGVKLTSLIGVTIAFYGVGLFMYSRLVNLKPAAIAFVGTGLAIIPFIGFALTSLGNLSNEVAWLITSAVGLVAYTIAAMRLQSQLVSYITMAFVLSLALSAVSILSLGVMWYFIVIIIVSLIINCVYLLMPNLLPDLFTKPLRDTGMTVTPIALIASLFAVSSMSLWMYVVLFAVATAHYFVVWLIQRTRTYEIIVRILAHLSVLLFVVELTLGLSQQVAITTLNLAWIGLAIAQIAYSLVRLVKNQDLKLIESMVVALAISAIAVSIPVWYAVPDSSYWVSGHLVLVGLVCFVTGYVLRQAGWLYGSLAASVFLPFVLARHVIDPALPFEAIAGVFTFAGLGSMFALDRMISGSRSRQLKNLFIISSAVYALVVAFCGALAADAVSLGWTMALSAGMFVALSHMAKLVGLESVGAVIAVVSVSAWVYKLLPQEQWHLTVAVILSTVMMAIGAAVYHRIKDFDRRNSLIALGMLVVAGLVLALTSSSVAVVRMATLTLLIISVGAIVSRGILAKDAYFLRSCALIGYILYPILAGLTAIWLGGGWLVLYLLVTTAIAWAASYLEKSPNTLVLGNILFATVVMTLWWWLDFSSEWIIYGIAWISAAVYYMIYWLSYSRADAQRMTISFGSILAVLFIAVLYGLIDPSTQSAIMSASSLLLIAAVVVIQGYIDHKDNTIEPAAYIATLGVQWIVSVLMPDINMVVYAHWWAIIIVLAAVWRSSYKTRLVVALSLVTASTGMFALSHQGGYSLFFLIEHLAVAIAGAMLRKQWAMWWGIIAVVLAVLHFLRGYTFLALLFLGLLLILFVVWRLVKLGDKK